MVEQMPLCEDVNYFKKREVNINIYYLVSPNSYLTRLSVRLVQVKGFVCIRCVLKIRVVEDKSDAVAILGSLTSHNHAEVEILLDGDQVSQW